MKVLIKQKCFTGGGGNMFAGEEHDLAPRIAEKLIERGLAEEIAAKPKAAPKKTNRAIGLATSDVKIVSAEDE